MRRAFWKWLVDYGMEEGVTSRIVVVISVEDEDEIDCVDARLRAKGAC